MLVLAGLTVGQAQSNGQRDSAAKALCSEKSRLKDNFYVESGSANLVVPLAKASKVDNVRVHAIKGACAQFVNYYSGDTYYLSTDLKIQAKPGIIGDIDPRPEKINKNNSLAAKDGALSKGVLVDSILVSPSHDHSDDKYLGAWVTNGKTRLLTYSKSKTGVLRKREAIAEIDGQVVSLAQIGALHRVDQGTLYALVKGDSSLFSVALDIYGL
ncbi:hypothetical protein FQJ88_15530 [Xanthomonas vasicola]|uniref:Uncharacterized protein n=1 Tax=Xanthomonas vasicola TaxID=56459 RepID=A0ABD7S6U1_XANVA|nr:hypothetical protein [Xanthomonas vasicola]TWQ48306.1 hypothetical protein FQK01_23755 [Xanthomonas vasicola]TWQ62890.1 hypothetical protein FQJ90_16075 [Xanthomonas vasicola]TWQ67926.1 hypothetical protein FQJ91_15715 [Xanthomonas vasicola]TWQ93187.1 hypothetical protein FQJ88_15530 [Xanthomonas vasicola]TWR40711.1 hypothetical protein FQJ95_13225 [Xanthomonas vasicola]